MRKVFSQTVKRAGFLSASMLLLAQLAFASFLSVLVPAAASATATDHPTCEGRVEINVNASTWTVPAEYNNWQVWTKAGNNNHQNRGELATNTVVTSGEYNKPVGEPGRNELDISHVDVCPTDICPNIDGVQTVIPDGMIKDIDGNCVTQQTNPCDLSVSTQIPADVDCVTFEVKAICSVLKLKSFTNNLTGKSWADDYEVRWAETAPAATQDAYETHGSNTWPAAFAEDYSGGSVTVWYWLVGPENDYISGRGMPNSGEKNAASVDIDTDCVDPITGSISGYKWNDGNGDKNSTGESKLSGWKIFLDENSNYVWDAGELFELTDANGNYEFSNLPLGDYTICEVMQTGWMQTAPATQTECYETTLTENSPSRTGKRFGNKQIPQVDYCDPTQKPGGVSIAKWLSDNQVNKADCFNYEVVEECGFLNVIVTDYPTKTGWAPYTAVYTTDGTVIYPANSFPANFTEDQNGGSVDVTWYLVGPEKDYLTGSGLPNFWDGTSLKVTVDTDCEEPVDPCEEIKLPSILSFRVAGDVAIDDDCDGRIYGHKFNDANGNAAYDASEEKLSGWTISICEINDPLDDHFSLADCDGAVASTVTDIDGNYSFDNVPTGHYLVCETQKDGWTRTYPAGSDCQKVFVDAPDKECEAIFGNKAKVPGEVLGEETPDPVLVNTGSSFSYGIIAGLSIIGAAAAVVTRRQRETNTI